MKNYQEQYERLLSLTNMVTRSFTDSKAELDRSLKRTSAFLEALGSPEALLSIVHVGGTSGKGSVVNHLHHIFHTNGEAVASYTSPHTTSFLERFKFNDGLVKAGLLAECIDDVIRTYENFIDKHGWLSFFELSTCLALYTFKKAGAERCVLEVGCGGRYDATNVIPTPDVAIITNIDKDHTDILGNTLPEIAFEKAGIIKQRGMVICGETRPNLKKIFQQEAQKTNAALFFVPPPSVQIVKQEFGFSQQHNAALAVRAARELGVDDAVIEKANKTLRRLPCRFETIQTNPSVILDGAHSPAKIASTVKLIKSLKKPVHVLYGGVASKDHQSMLTSLAPAVKRISTTRFTGSYRKAAVPHELLKFLPKSKRGQAFLDPFEALEETLRTLPKGAVLLVTGSLFLAGELRVRWVSEADIAKHGSSFKA